MRRDRLRAGDVVEVNIRGRRFDARVEGDFDDERIAIRPLEPGNGHHACSPRQVRKRLYRPPRRLAALDHLPGIGPPVDRSGGG
jgi:hypothetical protein